MTLFNSFYVQSFVLFVPARPGAPRRRKKKFLTIFRQNRAKTHVDGKWSGILKTLKHLCARPSGRIQK